MTTESAGDTHQEAPSVLARCLRIAAGCAALLVLSEVIWLWQTWPVRQLVQPQAQPAAPAPRR